MAFRFTPDLETGNAFIDSGHRQLFQAVNDLLNVCAAGKGRAELERSAKFLYDYTIKHFSDEEKLQIQTNYPDYTNHKRYHEEFKKVVASLTQELKQQGATISLVGAVNSCIAGWLVDHIKREDVKVAAHIRSQM